MLSDLDEKSEKEKRSTVNYLIQAASFPGAVKSIEEVMGGTMIDYVITSVTETQFMDVFQHTIKTEKEASGDMRGNDVAEQINNNEA